MSIEHLLWLAGYIVLAFYLGRGAYRAACKFCRAPDNPLEPIRETMFGERAPLERLKSPDYLRPGAIITCPPGRMITYSNFPVTSFRIE